MQLLIKNTKTSWSPHRLKLILVLIKKCSKRC